MTHHKLELFISKSCHVILSIPKSSIAYNPGEGTVCTGFQPEQARELAKLLILKADEADTLEKEEG